MKAKKSTTVPQRLDRIQELVWLYLIGKGTVLVETSYYGNTTDSVMMSWVRDNVDKIDWTKTTPVEDGYDEEFNGTFAEPNQIKYIRGDLYIGDKKLNIYFKIDSDWNFSEVVRDVVSILEKGE
jgi:hypothetical protein